MSRLTNILSGWYNSILEFTLTPDQLEVATRRLESCSTCKFAKERWVKKIWPDSVDGQKEKRFRGYKCEICSCPLARKVFAFNDSCPLPDYGRDHYPFKKRWAAVQFDEHNNLIGSDGVLITEPSESPVAMLDY